MLDLKYYTEILMDQNGADLVMRFFHKKEFASLGSAIYFFKNRHIENLSWIQNESLHQPVSNASLAFSEKLIGLLPSLEDKQNMLYQQLDYNNEELSFLEVKDSQSKTCICPKCGDRNERGWLTKGSGYRMFSCNHRSSCGFKGDLIKTYAQYFNKTYGEALNLLAQSLNIDFTVDEIHIGQKVAPKALAKPVAPKPIVEKIKYMEFDESKKYINLELSKFLPSSEAKLYSKMNQVQKWKVFVTALYQFSLTTKQWGKDNYFRKQGIKKDNEILSQKTDLVNKKLGFLHAADIKPLITHLKDDCLFTDDDLFEFGLTFEESCNKKGKIRISCEEGLVVIPNFDLYTNMVTGLKLRKTKLKTWVKNGETIIDTNKEPEFSYGRQAQPLPYLLTRDALLNKSIKFRFFEGQKDLHSMPNKKGYCDIAIPGTNGIGEEMLGLFKGRIVELFFDQDPEGQAGALKLKELLEKAGAIVLNKTWNETLGGDVNDVLQNGNILKIINL